MPRARTPHQGILERFLQRAVNLVAHILNGRVLAHDERLAEVRLFSLSAFQVRYLVSVYGSRRRVLPLGVEPHQAQFLPDPLYNLLHSEIELAGHDGRVRLAG